MTLSVELSAYRYINHELGETCNERPDIADGFSIHISESSKPFPFHIENVTILDIHSANIDWDVVYCRIKAQEEAWKKADLLAKYLECELRVKIVRPEFVERG